MDVYDRMRRQDAQVISVIRAVTLPIRRTRWWIDPNGAWYRPYLLWLILIVVTFILQSQRDADEL